MIDSIQKKLLDILQSKLPCACQELQQYLNVPLTGAPFFFSEIEMVYLLFEIEKEFGIRMRQEQLLSYGFSTLNQITMQVQECLS